MTPARIQLIGRDNTVPAHMTDAQREQAEGPFEQPVTHWDRAGYAIGGLAVFFSFMWWLA